MEGGVGSWLTLPHAAPTSLSSLVQAQVRRQRKYLIGAVRRIKWLLDCQAKVNPIPPSPRPTPLYPVLLRAFREFAVWPRPGCGVVCPDDLHGRPTQAHTGISTQGLLPAA